MVPDLRERLADRLDMVAPLPLCSSPPNTRDQLRGAHDLTLGHDYRADYGAFTRYQPPLVCCIALFAGSVIPLQVIRL